MTQINVTPKLAWYAANTRTLEQAQVETATRSLSKDIPDNGSIDAQRLFASQLEDSVEDDYDDEAEFYQVDHPSASLGLWSEDIK